MLIDNFHFRMDNQVIIASDNRVVYRALEKTE